MTDDPCATRTVPGGAVSEDNDSDLENQSHEDEMENDDEQVYEETFRQQAEQQKQLIVRETDWIGMRCGLRLVKTTENNVEHRTRMDPKRNNVSR